MERWDGRVAVVCDFAGSPTGLAICKDLVNHGLTVIGLTKNEGMRDLQASSKCGKLGFFFKNMVNFQILKGQLSEARGKLVPMECNVRDEGHVNPVFRWIGENYDGIDLLINNANSMIKGLILQDDNTQDLRQIMETNIMGLCIVTREAAKLMKMRPQERKNIGHIINITSTIGQTIDNCVPAARPVNGLYPASKWEKWKFWLELYQIQAFVNFSRHSAKAITECVRQELLYMDENVKITVRIEKLIGKIFSINYEFFQAISPGLVENDTIHSEISNEPALSAKDVSAACLYAISVKDNVQVWKDAINFAVTESHKTFYFFQDWFHRY